MKIHHLFLDECELDGGLNCTGSFKSLEDASSDSEKKRLTAEALLRKVMLHAF